MRSVLTGLLLKLVEESLDELPLDLMAPLAKQLATFRHRWLFGLSKPAVELCR